jgi:hypothetical protein
MKLKSLFMSCSVIVLSGLSANSTAATVSRVEINDSQVLCDRFLGDDEHNKCLSFIKKNKPDTYISSVCHYLFDDKEFNNCLKLATEQSSNPVSLEDCAKDHLEDKDRMRCLKAKSIASKDSFQRTPAGKAQTKR